MVSRVTGWGRRLQLIKYLSSDGKIISQSKRSISGRKKVNISIILIRGVVSCTAVHIRVA